MNVPGSALCMAATTLVGQYIGRNDVKGAKDTLIYLVKFTTVCLVSIGIIIFPISEWVARIYTDVPEIIKLTGILVKSIIITVRKTNILKVLSLTTDTENRIISSSKKIYRDI